MVETGHERGRKRRAVLCKVTGQVQGVGFRFFAIRAASDCGVTGYVRNLRDGGVEALAEGLPDAVACFVSALHEGPAAGRVDAVDVRDVEATGAFRGFDVRF